MHFDFKAYEKVYPSQPEVQKQPETMAEGFEPTKDEMAKDNKQGDEKVIDTPAEPETAQPQSAGEPAQNAGEPADGTAPEGSNNG